jgi:putative membrane protein
MDAAKRVAYALTLAAFALTWIAPAWPAEQALHSSLTVVALAALWWIDRRWPLQPLHFAAVCTFLVVHCIAARWLYSNVPYDQWWQAMTGWSLQQAMGWERNHFDRLVHLMFGLCFAAPLREHLRQRWPLTSRQAFVLCVGAIMCASLAYEWLEWAIALTLDPAAAEAYNGQQGDMWDAHMDMLLATLGALAAWPRRPIGQLQLAVGAA